MKFSSSLYGVMGAVLFLSGCSNAVQKHGDLPPGAVASVDGKGRFHISGEAAKGITLTTDADGTVHVAHTLYLSGAQTDTTDRRISDGFESPVAGKGSEWPFYVLEASFACPYDWKAGSFGQKTSILAPLSQGSVFSRKANIYPGLNAVVSGHVFIDYAGKSQIAYGVFVNDVGVQKSTVVFQPKTGKMKVGSFKFFANEKTACRADVALYPGPKMMSDIAWRQNSGRFPWDFQNEGGSIAGGSNGGMYDPINPMTGGFGKSVAPLDH